MQQYDYIIVGKGFAGGLLALTLKQRNRNVLLIDDASQSQCSRVAAGILNPANFRSLAPTWNAATLAPFAVDFYQKTEQGFHKKIFTPRTLYRVLTEKEARAWPAAKPFFGAPAANPFPGILEAPHGVAEITTAGNLDASAFGQLLDELLAENQLREPFDETALQISDTHVAYKTYHAHAIIFCRGFREAESTLFSGIPFQLLKGQLLQVQIPALQTDAIINGAGYLAPKNTGEYIFGATHEREQKDETCTEAGKAELEKKLQDMFTAPYTVTAHLAGVRPTIRDHRPVLGFHPQHPRVAIFNGLGSKGSLQGPWLAEQLAELLETGKPLLPEISIMRFHK